MVELNDYITIDIFMQQIIYFGQSIEGNETVAKNYRKYDENIYCEGENNSADFHLFILFNLFYIIPNCRECNIMLKIQDSL